MKPNFEIFDPTPCKNYGVVSEVSELELVVAQGEVL